MGTDVELIGRRDERARLNEALERAARGDSATIVVSGAPGIGKTTLLGPLAATARERGFSVLSARGYEGDADLPYASLLELLRPVLARRSELPAVQARALGVALALEEPAAADRFAVAAAVLSLLSAAAEAAPVLVVVDDLQWVDEASRAALLFAARRLSGESVALVIALRDEEPVAREVDGLDRLDLDGLPPQDAIALVALAGPDIPRAVAATLAERAAGNPLALVELPTVLTAAQRAGRAPLDGPLPLGANLERAFGRRVGDLPAQTRRALIAATLMEPAELPALHRALDRLGLEAGALAPAEHARLVVVRDERLDFRHPLVRSAVHQLASDDDRRTAHRVLADLADDPRRRAWHLASAAVHPQADVADELDAVAIEARDRGGHAAAAHAWERAAALTPAAGRAAGRRLAAARAWLDAGHPEQALTALDNVAAGIDDGPTTGDVARVRAQVELRRGHPMQAHALLVAEADRLAPTAPGLAAETMLEAAVAHMMTGDTPALVADATRARDLARAGGSDPVTALADVLIGATHLAMGRGVEGDARLQRRTPFLLTVDPLASGAEVFAMAGHASYWTERWDRADAVLERIVGAAREANAFGKLVYPLAARAQMSFRRGDWLRALADADESVQLARATGQTAILAHALGVLAEVEAGLGRTEQAQEHVREGLALTDAFGLAAVSTYVMRAAGIDHLGQGRISAAIDALAPATRLAETLALGSAGLVMFLPDHVEALVRAGRDAEAGEVLTAFDRRVATTGGTWAPAAAARCAGLLAAPGDCDEHFQRALDLHARGEQPFEHARTALLYGERLRRRRQRARAREPLALALELFERLGARPWAQRAEHELVAAGGCDPRPRRRPASDRLTPAELQVALMVARGLRNREVAASLFLSEKTVERHLTAIYRKLDLRSRAELASSLGSSAS